MIAAAIAIVVLYAAYWLASDHHHHSQFYDMFWRQAGGLWLDPCSGEVTYGDGRPFCSPSGPDMFPVRPGVVSGPNYLREQHEKNRLARQRIEAVEASIHRELTDEEMALAERLESWRPQEWIEIPNSRFVHVQLVAPQGGEYPIP